MSQYKNTLEIQNKSQQYISNIQTVRHRLFALSAFLHLFIHNKFTNKHLREIVNQTHSHSHIPFIFPFNFNPHITFS